MTTKPKGHNFEFFVLTLEFSLQEDDFGLHSPSGSGSGFGKNNTGQFQSQVSLKHVGAYHHHQKAVEKTIRYENLEQITLQKPLPFKNDIDKDNFQRIALKRENI